MPTTFRLLLLLLSLVCFLLASWQITSPMWHRLISAGLALLTASMVQW